MKNINGRTQKVQLINYAKNLYLIYNEQGERKYTYRQIAEKISRRYKVDCHFSTISIWAKKYGWTIADQTAKQTGLTKSLVEIPVEKETEVIEPETIRTNEEAIEEAKSNEIAKIAINAQKMSTLAQDIAMRYLEQVKESEVVTTQAVMIANQLLRTSQETYLKLLNLGIENREQTVKIKWVGTEKEDEWEQK